MLIELPDGRTIDLSVDDALELIEMLSAAVRSDLQSLRLDQPHSLNRPHADRLTRLRNYLDSDDSIKLTRQQSLVLCAILRDGCGAIGVQRSAYPGCIPTKKTGAVDALTRNLPEIPDANQRHFA